MLQVQNCLVTPEESGQKLLSYLKRKMGQSFPESGLMRLIRTGQVRVNKKRCRPFHRLRARDMVRIPPYKPADRPAPCLDQSRDQTVDIVHSTRDFLLVNKPGNLPVHSGTGHDHSLTLRVHALYPQASFQPTPVHRLDRGTSGLILFALSYSWLRQMQKIWAHPSVRKIYLALVQGRWPWQELEIKDRLIRDHHGVRTNPQGRPAISRVSLMNQNQDRSLLMVSISTGRTHQIRVHLAEKGYPVIGDLKYGGAQSRIMHLHSFRLIWPGHDFRLMPSWLNEPGNDRPDSGPALLNSP
ncbi:MAG: RluA family pseudouridine synthase [Desulfonatronovibrionaceae bacterium]